MLAQSNNRNTRKRREICSNLIIKTPERRQQRRSNVFIVNFELTAHLFQVFILVTLNKLMFTGLFSTLPPLTEKQKNYSKCLSLHPGKNLIWKNKDTEMKGFTLILLTKLAVLLATSLADCTKCLLATGLSVFVEAALHALHSPAVCLAITVAAESTCKYEYLS